LILKKNGKYLALLPGPPRELKPMWRDSMVPWLRETFQPQPLEQRVWRIIGVGEGQVQELLEEAVLKIAPFEVGYCSRPGEVDFRLISLDPALLDKADAVVRATLKNAVYGLADTPLEQVVVELAARSRRTVATAESCTGGLVANRLTNVPGSSAVFKFGWVTYSNEAKAQELGVAEALLREHGAVSEPVAKAMAEGALKKSGADMAVALTGIAGPEGGTPDKPVGLLWLGMATREKVYAVKKNLPTDRETYKYSASQQALDLLRTQLLGD
jgi:nicotinamide-nucleotide amidase